MELDEIKIKMNEIIEKKYNDPKINKYLKIGALGWILSLIGIITGFIYNFPIYSFILMYIGLIPIFTELILSHPIRKEYNKVLFPLKKEYKRRMIEAKRNK